MYVHAEEIITIWHLTFFRSTCLNVISLIKCIGYLTKLHILSNNYGFYKIILFEL